MAGWLALIAKFVLIAFAAGVAAWVPAGLHFAALGADLSKAADTGNIQLFWLQISLLGSFAVGLPVALLVYYLAAPQLAQRPATIFLIAALAGVMMILTCAVFGDASSMVLFGIPSFIAANTYAVLGYFLIIRPMRQTADV